MAHPTRSAEDRPVLIGLAVLLCLGPLVPSAPAAACLYDATRDVWDMALEADRIVVVEAESWRPSRWGFLVDFLHEQREASLEAASRRSRDLEIFLETTIPELPKDLPGVMELRATHELHAEGPLSRRSSMSLSLGSFPPAIVPGYKGVVFLERTVLGYRLLPYYSAILSVSSDSELDDLVASITAALALQADGVYRPPRDWQTLTLSLPGSRLHAKEPSNFDRDEVTGALARLPGHPWKDLLLLYLLRDHESTDLDRLAVQWLDALTQLDSSSENEYLIGKALQVVLHRWTALRGTELEETMSQIPYDDREVAEASWIELRRELQIPHFDVSVQLERLREMDAFYENRAAAAAEWEAMLE